MGPWFDGISLGVPASPAFIVELLVASILILGALGLAVFAVVDVVGERHALSPKAPSSRASRPRS